MVAYSSIVSDLLDLFWCVETSESAAVLYIDESLECFTPKHILMMLVAVIVLFALGLMLPVLVATVTHNVLTSSTPGEFRLCFGRIALQSKNFTAFFEDYGARLPYYESVMYAFAAAAVCLFLPCLCVCVLLSFFYRPPLPIFLADFVCSILVRRRIGSIAFSRFSSFFHFLSFVRFTNPNSFPPIQCNAMQNSSSHTVWRASSFC